MSDDVNAIEHDFHILKTKPKAERPANEQQLKAATVEARQSIPRDETQHLHGFHSSDSQ